MFTETWKRIRKKVRKSLEQKYKRLLESMKDTPLKGYKEELEFILIFIEIF